MKAKATVIVNMDRMEIHSIRYCDRVLNVCGGKIRMNKFYSKKILEAPLQDFKPHTNRLFKGVTFMKVEMIINVFPHIWLNQNAVIRKDFPYKCELYPFPVNKHSVMSYEEFSFGMNKVLDKISSRVVSSLEMHLQD